MHPNPRRILPLVLPVVIVAVTGWYLLTNKGTVQAGVLTASGTIEATEVTVSTEVGGQVVDVLVRVGDSVQAGQVLLRFDDQLLKAQLEQAQAAVVQAQANYDLVAAGTPEEQRRAMIAAAELELVAAQQDLNELHELADLATAQANYAVAAADEALDNSQQVFDNMTSEAATVDIDAAWASVVIAKDKLDKAREDFQPYEKKPEDNLPRAIFQAKLTAAQKHYDHVVTVYNNLVGTSNRFELALAQANVELAQAKLAEARRRFAELADGPDPDALSRAEARLSAAQAQLAAVQAGPTPYQLEVARAQVQVAETALKVVLARIAKLEVLAPADGVVLTRLVEPGEVVNPSAPLLTIAQLQDLTLTVYVPEDRYGTINLGQVVRVTVDSFPEEEFQATVVRIADEAEFTPRNVQTEEGRRTTVFAIELVVDDPNGDLKPGMPADVWFSK